MEKNKNNPVEGRLGIPSPTKTKPHTKSTRKKTNYGFERLGIISDTEPESDKPVSELPEKQKIPLPPTNAAQPIAVSPVSKEITGQSESSETPKTEHRYAISGKLARYKNILARRKTKKILLLTGIPVIAMTLILWISFDDVETTPQSASATDQSHSDQAARKHVTGNTAKPTKPALVKIPQHTESEQAIPAETPATSTIHEVLKFLSKMEPEPKTITPVPAQVEPSQKPDKPKDADPKPVVKTAPIIALAPQRLGIRLGGIMRGADGKIALINNRSVKVGQTVNNAKVVHIGDFSVEVELDGKRYLVAISSTPPVKTSNGDKDESSDSDSDDDEAESETEEEEE